MWYRAKVLQAVLFALGLGFLLSCLFKSGALVGLLGVLCIALSLLFTKCH